jgi:hypothetical protein
MILVENKNDNMWGSATSRANCLRNEEYWSEIGTLIADGEELGFTWQTCELCQNSGGHDGFKVVCLTHQAPREVLDFNVCQDCLMYVAYGEQ